MTTALLEAPLHDDLNLLNQEHDPSQLQRRFLSLIGSVGMVMTVLQQRQPDHPQVGSFQVALQKTNGAEEIKGLLVGEYSMHFHFGGSGKDPEHPVESKIGTKTAGHLITPSTIYQHRALRVTEDSRLNTTDTLMDLVPHQDVDALDPRSRMPLERVIQEGEFVVKDYAVRYGIDAGLLPVYNSDIF